MPMNDNIIRISNRAEGWGIVSMMERIENIQQKFGANIFPKVDRSAFQKELENSAGTAPAKSIKERGGDELFAPGTFTRPVPGASTFDPLISQAADKYDLSQSLLKAVIKAESNFNPRAVSSKGAMGLMQLMPGTARDLNVSDPFDPAQNIDGGARYLKQMLDRFGGDTKKALSAYNAGPKAVETYGGTPPYKETQDYVGRILNMLSGG